MHLEVGISFGQELLHPTKTRPFLVGEGRELRRVDLTPGDESDRCRVEVDPDDMRRIDVSELWRDQRAEVSTLCSVALVAEPAHELGPGLGDATGVPPLVPRRSGETETWDRRDDEMERITRSSAVSAGIGKRTDDLGELGD